MFYTTYDTEFKDVMEFINEFNDAGFASGITNFFYDDNKIILKYTSKRETYYSIYNTKENIVEYNGSLTLYDNIKINQLFCSEGRIFAYISAYRLIEAKEKDKRVAELVEKYKLTNNSCPLIVVLR
ncbi:MAG: hypothetical protein R3Y50_05265 [Rikenellaceae bacterium]